MDTQLPQSNEALNVLALLLSARWQTHNFSLIGADVSSLSADSEFEARLFGDTVRIKLTKIQSWPLPDAPDTRLFQGVITYAISHTATGGPGVDPDSRFWREVHEKTQIIGVIRNDTGSFGHLPKFLL